MKQTLTVAHARHSAPMFIQLTRYELLKLRCHTHIARVLYEELVALSNFVTGHIFQGSDPRCSYAMLIALLTPDAPAHGGRRVNPPTLKQIRDALDDLQNDGLVGRNTAANKGTRSLFLEVLTRKGAATLSANQGRGKGRHQKASKPNKHAASSPVQLPIRAEVGAGVSEGDFINTPYPQNSPQLSTGAQPRPPEPSDPPGPIVFGAADQKIGPPRGADTSPPKGGHAPRRDTFTQRAMRAGMKTKIDPPGGQVDAPQGDQSATEPMERIRRTRKTVLKGEGGEVSGGQPALDPGQDAPDQRRSTKVCTLDEWPWPGGI